MPLQLDPEFAEVAGPLLQQLAKIKKPAPHDIAARRHWSVAVAKGFQKNPLPDGLEYLVYHVPTPTGDHQIAIHHYRKTPARSEAGQDHKDSAVIHLHGGGFFSLSPVHFEKLLVWYVSDSGVQMLSVDYRLAPEHPYPIPIEDSWTALQWVYANAETLFIDTSRIGIMGESAGGGLAAGLALIARDRGLSPPLAKQILVYPMLDDRLAKHHGDELAFAFWTFDDNITGWTAYLGEDVQTDRVSQYAAPARAESVEGLPPTYIDCGQLDIFVQEDMEYALRFVKAGIPLEFHVYPGVPHGFEGLAPATSYAQRAMDNRCRAMREI